MAAAENYRRFAAECLTLAQQLTDPDARAKMLEMAEAWRRLARWSEDQERKKA